MKQVTSEQRKVLINHPKNIQMRPGNTNFAALKTKHPRGAAGTRCSHKEQSHPTVESRIILESHLKLLLSSSNHTPIISSI